MRSFRGEVYLLVGDVMKLVLRVNAISLKSSLMIGSG